MRSQRYKSMVLVLACIMIIGAAVPAVALSNQALPAFDRKVTERIETENILQHIKMLSEESGLGLWVPVRKNWLLSI
jgi:hypothetical protein